MLRALIGLILQSRSEVEWAQPRLAVTEIEKKRAAGTEQLDFAEPFGGGCGHSPLGSNGNREKACCGH